MNALVVKNRGFSDYLDAVSDSITLGQDAMMHKMDTVYSKEELNKLLEERVMERLSNKKEIKENKKEEKEKIEEEKNNQIKKRLHI